MTNIVQIRTFGIKNVNVKHDGKNKKSHPVLDGLGGSPCWIPNRFALGTTL